MSYSKESKRSFTIDLSQIVMKWGWSSPKYLRHVSFCTCMYVCMYSRMRMCIYAYVLLSLSGMTKEILVVLEAEWLFLYFFPLFFVACRPAVSWYSTSSRGIYGWRSAKYFRRCSAFTCVCMYACMHICMYACTDANPKVLATLFLFHMCVYACMHGCMDCMHCTWLRMYTYLCLHVRVFVCVHTYTCEAYVVARSSNDCMCAVGMRL